MNSRNMSAFAHRLRGAKATCRWAVASVYALLGTLILPGVATLSRAADTRSVTPIAAPVATTATCGATDRPETGLPGDTPLVDRFAPGVPHAFNCNLGLVGQAQGEGAALGMAITDRCIYFSQQVAPGLPVVLEHSGLAIVDAAKRESPKIAGFLDMAGTIGSDQSFVVSPTMLITTSDYDRKGDQIIVNESGQTVDIFDIQDCTHPALKFSGVIPHFAFHTGELSADAKTLWTGSGPDRTIGAVSALDVSDASQPRLLAQWRPDDPRLSYIHNVTVSDDGNIAYVVAGSVTSGLRSQSSQALSWKDLDKEPPQGLVILDVSDVQARNPDATIKMMSSLFWNDVQVPQYVYPMTVKGHKYVWYNDLMGALSSFNVAQAGRTLGAGPRSLKGFDDPAASSPVACQTYPTRPPFGYVSIIDVENPRKPVRVSGIRLGVNQPKHCAMAAVEPRLRGYLPMWCNVDNAQDAQMIACAYGESGVRVFDIRDVKHPREIAYYKPAAAGTAVRRASNFQAFLDTSGTLQGSYHSADLTAMVFFASGGKEIWITSIDGGAQILRFSDDLIAREKALFSRDMSCGGKLRGVHGCP